MKKTMFVVMMFAGLVGLTGCQNTNSPQGVLETAASALQANDLHAFSAVLTGDALAEYATPSGFAALRSEVAGLELTIGDVGVGVSNGCGTHCTLTTYDAEILARPANNGNTAFQDFATAGVECFEHVYTGPKERTVVSCRLSEFGPN